MITVTKNNEQYELTSYQFQVDKPKVNTEKQCVEVPIRLVIYGRKKEHKQ